MAIKMKNPGIYQALIAQLDKTARHNRQGSFRTKERYYEAMQRFCRFLADEYHLQKLANVSGKHLTAYVIHMQAAGKSASTLKTDLAAIRFFHDKLERAKYRLPSNDELSVELERRRSSSTAKLSLDGRRYFVRSILSWKKRMAARSVLMVLGAFPAICICSTYLTRCLPLTLDSFCKWYSSARNRQNRCKAS